MEGLSLASNIQGMLADALIAIFKLKAIPNMLKWVDDFLFFHIPSLHPPSIHSPSPVHYDYDIMTILAITNPKVSLGIWSSPRAKNLGQR